MRRKPEAVHADVLRARKNLERFTLASLANLARIDKFEVWDVTGGGGGPKPKNAISDPVGNKVASIGAEQDPVGKAVKSIERTLFEIARQTDILVQQLAYVTDPRQRQADADRVVHCEACKREVAATRSDRLRSGYCSACYTRWIRENKPYRGTFEQSVREGT